MKRELYYTDSTHPEKNHRNLCGALLSHNTKIYMLPDRKISFISIFEFPPAPKSRLRDLAAFHVKKIYPGHSREIIFDFIPFKTQAGWKVVIYTLKMNRFSDIITNKNFRGVVLPLQFISKQKLKKISGLFISYPDMVEYWGIRNGIPYINVRYDKHDFPLMYTQLQENKKTELKETMAIVPLNEIEQWKTLYNIGSIKTFTESFNSLKRKIVYFKNLQGKRKDILTPVIVLLALALSLFLLFLTISKKRELQKEEASLKAYNITLHKQISEVQKKQLTIKKLKRELAETTQTSSVNVYNLLLKVRRAMDASTTLDSFSFKGQEFALTLTSHRALINLQKLDKELGILRVSNIKKLPNDNEKYTVWVEAVK